MSWFSSLFGRPERAAEPGDGARDESLAELGEGLQKLARVQARQGVRLEDLEGKLEAGFADLRAAVLQASQDAPAAIRWDDLLDAADALDEAERAAAAAGDASMSAGLRGVAARIGRFLSERSVRRETRLGAAPDPARVRVVGTVEASSMTDGQVARVVRAAVTEQGRLLREGEVLVARSAPPPSPEESPREEVNR